MVNGKLNDQSLQLLQLEQHIAKSRRQTGSNPLGRISVVADIYGQMPDVLRKLGIPLHALNCIQVSTPAALPVKKSFSEPYRQRASSKMSVGAREIGQRIRAAATLMVPHTAALPAQRRNGTHNAEENLIW